MDSATLTLDVPDRPSAHPSPTAARALRLAGGLWLGIAVFGQLLLATYVTLYYGGATLAQDFARWNEVLGIGLQAGQPALNAVLAAHLLFVVVILGAGALQLLPPLRRALPAVHRVVGRAYLVAALVLAIGGLALVWLREAIGDTSQHLGISLNAALIVAFAALAWSAARRHDTAAHRRWALRLFLVVGGVWFFRIGLMLWVAVWREPLGFDPKTFTGPTLTVFTWGQSLLPLVVLEAYFRSQRADATRQWAMTAVMGVANLLTLCGIAAASAMLWWPRIGG